MVVTIYHNPRCSKSRQALNLLEQQGIKPRIVEYLKTPPSASEIKRVLRLLGLRPRDLLRKKEMEYKKAKLDDPDLPDEAVIRAMVKYPVLIERPIVIVEDRGRASIEKKPAARAALGRPPENVLEIL